MMEIHRSKNLHGRGLCSFIALVFFATQLPCRSAEKKELEELTRLANAGDMFAQADLGAKLYLNNVKEAVKWSKKAADRGSARGQHTLGLCYFYGRGLPKDRRKACKLFREAARQQHAMSQYQLGLCYERGEGVEKNLADAVKWYTKAAHQKLDVGAFHLGRCYEKGIGVEKDLNEAVKWYKKADLEDARKRLASIVSRTGLEKAE